MSANEPSNWQQLINGEWHGLPSLYEPDGTHVGVNKVSRASEHIDGKTLYWRHVLVDSSDLFFYEATCPRINGTNTCTSWEEAK